MRQGLRIVPVSSQDLTAFKGKSCGFCGLPILFSSACFQLFLVEQTSNKLTAIN